MTKYIDWNPGDPEPVVVEHTGTLEEFQADMSEMRHRSLMETVVALRVRILELETELREAQDNG